MNTKMKVLSLALVGLCGYAGSAMAACPTSPGAWTAASALGGSVTFTDAANGALATGGLDGSECRMDAAITANSGSATAFVRDDSPNNEPTYRAQFKINANNLVSQNSAQPVRIFQASTNTPAFSVPAVISLTMYGNAAGTARVLGISTVCASAASHVCTNTFALNPTATNTIEIQWVKGASGAFKVWVNNGTEASPDVNMSLDNSAWGGIDSITMGLAAASAPYRTAQVNKGVGFDRFDSRRSTFIGSP